MRDTIRSSSSGRKGSSFDHGKCTCSGGSSSNGNKSRKSSAGSRSVGGSAAVVKSKSVSKRDMATSPNLGQKSPKIMIPGNILQQQQQHHHNYPPPPKSPTVKSRTTRSAATSPRVDLKQRPALSPIRIDPLASGSGGYDSPISPRPTDITSKAGLRTARSLSPRPPMRHQHAITVCDENEVVSVALSPNDLVAVDTVGHYDRKSAKRCQSEHASPNVFEDRNFLYDEKIISTNRSTGCLVYVPSDPWLRMSDEDVVVINPNNKTKKNKKQNAKPSGIVSADAKPSSSSGATKFVFPEAKSRSKPNILDYDDPWVWKGDAGKGQAAVAGSSAKGSGTGTGQRKMDKQKMLNRQAKSLQSKVSTEKEHYSAHFTGTTGGSQSRMKDAISTGDMRAGKVRTSSGTSRGTLDRDLLKVGKVSSSSNVSSSLQVNVNLQPRHSFSSTPSQRDDELQLSIRRLSEQTRHANRSPMGSAGTGMNRGAAAAPFEYDYNCTWDRGGGASRVKRKSRPSQEDLTAVDPLLETTC